MVTTSAALDGVRVLDLTNLIAGPYCTKQLADFGADVIELERPGAGDPSRRLGPFPGDLPDPEHSGLFLLLNQNKRSVTLNLQDAAGRQLLRALIATSDVVMESLRPRSREPLGISWEQVHACNPHAVLVSISNFGSHGPYRDYEATEEVIYALAGPMYSTGHIGREPLKIGDNLVGYQAGEMAALATSLALFKAESTGAADHVDLSIMETQAGNIDRQTPILLSYQFTGDVLTRMDPARQATRIWPCKDGYIEVGYAAAPFERILRLLGRLDLAGDPLFATQERRMQPDSQELFTGMLLAWLMEHTMAEAWAELQAHEIPSGPIFTAPQVLANPHFHPRGVWQQARLGESKVTIPGRPFLLERTPWRLCRPAPALGEHTAEVLCGLAGVAPAALPALRAAGVI